MKKLTALIIGKETIINLQDSILTTKYTYVFVKKATIFWEYQNVSETTDIAKHSGSRPISANPGYYTFDDISELISSDDVTVSARKYDGRCTVTNNGSSSFLLSGLLCNLLGFNPDLYASVKTVAPGITLVSNRKVDVNRGLRYINISCNLVDMGSNIYVDGNKSGIITSLPITTTQSLFGSVDNYVDIESKVPVVKGSFNEVKFDVTDQSGNPVDVGFILLELYIV